MFTFEYWSEGRRTVAIQFVACVRVWYQYWFCVQSVIGLVAGSARPGLAHVHTGSARSGDRGARKQKIHGGYARCLRRHLQGDE